MVAANSRIWRDSNTVPVSDIIDFNNTPTLPDATGAIQQTNITLTSAFSRNPKPKSVPPEGYSWKQDMGGKWYMAKENK